MEEITRFKTLFDVVKIFSNEDICREHLKKMRWDDNPFCPHCGATRIYHFSDGKRYKCAECRKKFTVTVGTIFEDSKIPLQKWFMAIWLVTSHKKGISSIQLGKDLGVTQKTAWFMLHRLRHATQTKSFNQPLKNTVEIDETYIGGKERNKHISKRVKGTQGRSTKTKAVVIGMLERNGHLKIIKIPDNKGRTVRDMVLSNVVIGSKVCTDEFRTYNFLKNVYKHYSVNHSKGEYVIGDVHTNAIEGFWSYVKRGIIGVYHVVTDKHLQRYLNEYSFKFNTRNDSEESRFNLLLRNCNGRLKYNALISEA